MLTSDQVEPPNHELGISLEYAPSYEPSVSAPCSALPEPSGGAALPEPAPFVPAAPFRNKRAE